MSLQDDIARYIHQGRPRTALQDDIAAGLERDYWYAKLADLPPVESVEGDVVMCDGYAFRVEGNPGAQAIEFRRLAYRQLAVAEHLQSRESEAAARQARRDELLHQYGYELTYADQSPMVKDLINRLISADADHTRAGERS